MKFLEANPPGSIRLLAQAHVLYDSNMLQRRLGIVGPNEPVIVLDVVFGPMYALVLTRLGIGLVSPWGFRVL